MHHLEQDPNCVASLQPYTQNSAIHVEILDSRSEYHKPKEGASSIILGVLGSARRVMTHTVIRSRSELSEFLTNSTAPAIRVM